VTPNSPKIKDKDGSVLKKKSTSKSKKDADKLNSGMKIIENTSNSQANEKNHP